MTRTQVHSTTTEAGTPTDGESRPLDYPTGIRSPGRLPDRPTIVAVGPFDDIAHAEQLAAAFTVVRRVYEAQLALIGGGAERDAIVRRAAAHGVETDVHLIEDSSGPGWPDLLAAADLVVPSTTSSTTTIREVLAAGRAVVAPEHPATVGLVVPTSAGLIYRRGDVFGMAEAMLRLLTTPALRESMAERARDLAPRSRGLKHEARLRRMTNEQAVWWFRISRGSHEPN